MSTELENALAEIERLERMLHQFIEMTAPGATNRDARWREIACNARHHLRFPYRAGVGV